jgi:pseudouridine kinase
VDRADHLGKPVAAPRRILCIGGTAIDRFYETAGAPAIGTSNPARGWTSDGGVARNGAEVLVRLGAKPVLASMVGADEAGAGLTMRLETSGVDTALMAVNRQRRTAEYIGVFHRGELFAAFADMDIFDDMDERFCETRLETAGNIAGVFADCNLTADAITMLRMHCRKAHLPLAIDAVSLAKAQRLGKDLGGIRLLCLNRDEATTLAGTDPLDEPLTALRRRGAQAVIIGEGRHGVRAGDESGSFTLTMPRTEVANVSGAGDALAAGAFLGCLEGASLGQAVEFGMACAQAALSSPRSIPEEFGRNEAERRQRIVAEANRR